MKRRDALKALALSGMAISSLNAYDLKLITNKKDNVLQDPKKPNDFEYKHLPDITLSKDKDPKGYTLVEVSIGQHEIIHPSDANHWIYEIDLWADDKLVSKVSLEPVISRGYLAAKVKLDGVKMLKSTSKCNLHGNYTSTLSLA